MIKCNRCGMMTTAGAVYCQSCGEALSGNVDYDAAPKLAAQEQPELPAWLESLRAGERSTPPAQNVAGFSAADFIEEGSLPSWMRSERNEARDNTAGNLSASVRPDANSGEGSFSSNSINVQSLIDEQSLPSWMQGGGTPSSASGQVNQDTPPAWMQTLRQPPAPSKNPATFEPSVNTTGPVAPGFSARDLIDPQALPSWMSPQQGSQSAAPSSASQTGPSSQPLRMPQPGSQPATSGSQQGTPASGFSARDLIDPQALPSWMSQRGNQSGAPAGQMGPSSQPLRMPQSGSQQSGPAFNPVQTGVSPSGRPGSPDTSFSASSLLDMDALPPWLREGGQEPKDIRSASGNWPQPVQPGQSWQAPQQAEPLWPAQGQQNSAQGGGNVAASSFIDTNALPEWLRTANADPRAGGGPPQPGMAGGPRQGGYPVPPRVDNVRVPSRPRSEMGVHEGSEEAANVFASMLGVAPAAPNYPAPQPPQSYPQPGFMGNQPGQPDQGGMPNTPAGMNGQPAAGYPGHGTISGGYNGYAANGQGQGYQMNTPPSGAQQAPGNMARTPYGANGMADEQKNDAKSGKFRSFFDHIREWFER